MNQITLVISDIDGTLITSNHELTEATRLAARALKQHSIRLALASSRPPLAIVPIAREIELEGPFAAFNGALIVNADGHTIVESTIAPEISTRLITIADELRLDVWIYDTQGWWASRGGAFVDREEHTTGLTAELDGFVTKSREPISKLTIVGTPQSVASAEKRILEELGEFVSASRSQPRFLDVTCRGWHKGAVVARLGALHGADTAQIAVIGDGPNDTAMFREAGLSIAMGQAVAEVRSHANVVTSSNDDEGWARAIRKFVLGDTKA